MFQTLIDAYDKTLRVQSEKPYSADRVQAYGMVFAQEWNARKHDILKALGEPEFVVNGKGKQEENFDYGKWRQWMVRLKDNFTKEIITL